MGSKIEYVESSHMYATNYIRNSKAIGVLWGIFTICYAIIGVVAFVTPEWLGDLEHENPGRFGLWTRCSYGSNGTYVCVCVRARDPLAYAFGLVRKANLVFDLEIILRISIISVILPPVSINF